MKIILWKFFNLFLVKFDKLSQKIVISIVCIKIYIKNKKNPLSLKWIIANINKIVKKRSEIVNIKIFFGKLIKLLLRFLTLEKIMLY